MNLEELKKKLEKRHKEFEKLHAAMVVDINEYLDHSKTLTNGDFYLNNNARYIEKFISEIVHLGTWSIDRLKGKTFLSRGSLTKKIAKYL